MSTLPGSEVTITQQPQSRVRAEKPLLQCCTVTQPQSDASQRDPKCLFNKSTPNSSQFNGSRTVNQSENLNLELNTYFQVRFFLIGFFFLQPGETSLSEIHYSIMKLSEKILSKTLTKIRLD